jgi:hypothetical protein
VAVAVVAMHEVVDPEALVGLEAVVLAALTLMEQAV